MAQYQLFIRNWWRKDPSAPGGITPGPGRKTIVGYVDDEEAARARCKEYNDTHKPGKLSRKMEYTSNF